MELSDRLIKIAAAVSPCNTAADIGTDHGYIPIALVQEGKVQSAIACDIKEGPLRRAKAHIMGYGLSEKISVRQGSGLAPLLPGEAEAIIMAGMGGMLMVNILQEGLTVVKQAKQLILQPQRDIAKVRKYLHAIGFCIMQEEMLLEEGQYYTILSAEHGTEVYKTEAEYWFGKCLLERKDPILCSMVGQAIEKQREVIGRLQEAGTETAKGKLLELEKKQHLYEEVWKWLSTVSLS